MSENAIITVPEERTLSMISMEIRTLHAQAQQVVLGYAIEIGRRLTEAKTMVSHGEWGTWLAEEVNYSKSTANNFMRIFDAYGADQQGLFGPEAKSQALGNLPYTKALRLLAIPEEEREEFVESNHVEDISTRELEKLIKERDEANARASTAEQANNRLIGQKEELEKVMQAEADKLREEAKAANERAETSVQQMKKAQEELEKAKKRAEAAAEKLKKLQENPVPEDAVEKIRAEAESAAEKAAAEKLEENLKEAKLTTEAAKKEAEDARARAEIAEKKLALADEDTILFKAQFARVQEEFYKCESLLNQITATSPEKAEKLKTAVFNLLDSLKGRI